MILERYETNNGYRCNCCSRGYDDADWIENSDMLSFEELLEVAYNFNDNIDGRIALQYESNGIVLYGYETFFGRRWTEVYIIIGNDSYLIVADNLDKEILSKEDVLKIFASQE